MCNVRNFCDGVPIGSVFNGGLVVSSIVAGGAVFQEIDAGGGHYSLFRTPVDGGPPLLLDTTGALGRILGADADYVYGFNGSTVVREGLSAPLGNQPETVFTPVSPVLGLRVQAGAIYYPASDGKIYKRSNAVPGSDAGLAIAGGVSSEGIRKFATTPGHMYWTYRPGSGLPHDSLRVSNIDGGGLVDVTGAAPATDISIAVTGEDVLFVQSSDPKTDGVYRYSAGRNPQQLLAKSNITDLAVSDARAYVVENGKNVFSFPAAGGDALPVAEITQPNGSSTPIAYWNAIAGFDAKRGFVVASLKTVAFTVQTYGPATYVPNDNYRAQIFAFVK